MKLERDGKLRARPELIRARKFDGARLEAVFMVSISGKNGVAELKSGTLKRYVYGNISRILGASEFSFMDSMHGFPHLDTAPLQKARFDFVSRLDGTRTYEIHGSIDSIAEEISKLSLTP